MTENTFSRRYIRAFCLAKDSQLAAEAAGDSLAAENWDNCCEAISAAETASAAGEAGSAHLLLSLAATFAEVAENGPLSRASELL